MEGEEAVILVVALLILAGAGLMLGALVNRRRMREMEHRERLAMIERGLIPSPETDPLRFEAASGLGSSREARRSTAVRYRTAGVLMIGLGLGLMLMISFTAGQPEVGVGVGGAWAVLGAASLLNYFLIIGGDDGPRTQIPQRWAPPPPRPEDPPSNVAP